VAQDPQAIAETVGRAMAAADTATRELGVELLEIGPGSAKLRMIVQPKMLNAVGICHGGYIFLLADAAFAFACNSYNRVALAQRADISFTAKVAPGSVLTATAREAVHTGRSGVYDIEVRDQDSTLVGLFRGHSREVKGEVVPGLT